MNIHICTKTSFSLAQLFPEKKFNRVALARN